MKQRAAFFIGSIVCLMILGYVGHQDHLTEQLEQLPTVCNAKPNSTDCKALITAAEQTGQFEVLSNGVSYWVEAK